MPSEDSEEEEEDEEGGDTDDNSEKGGENESSIVVGGSNDGDSSVTVLVHIFYRAGSLVILVTDATAASDHETGIGGLLSLKPIVSASAAEAGEIQCAYVSLREGVDGRRLRCLATLQGSPFFARRIFSRAVLPHPFLGR